MSNPDRFRGSNSVTFTFCKRNYLLAHVTMRLLLWKKKKEEEKKEQKAQAYLFRGNFSISVSGKESQMIVPTAWL